VRTVLPASPAERAKIRAGECIQGIGRRIIYSSSDASAELRRHKIGEQVNYLVRNGPCVAPDAPPRAAAGTELRTVPSKLSSESLGGKNVAWQVGRG
jgi:S1-C subfamily serine protease